MTLLNMKNLTVGLSSTMYSYMYLCIDFSISILITNEMWLSVNQHTSLFMYYYCPIYNNTRLGTFKNMIYYIISSSSHVLKLYNVYHDSKDIYYANKYIAVIKVIINTFIE